MSISTIPAPPPIHRPPPTHHVRASRARRLWALVATASLVAVGIAIPITAAQAAPTLLSQGKLTTASSTENADYLPAPAATDGNAGTRWASQATDNQWLQVDLGQMSTISRVDLSWESAYASGYQIQVSDSGTGGWTSVFTTAAGKGGNESLTVAGTGRYMRMQGVKRATGYGYSLWEFQVYGTPGVSSGSGGGPCADNNIAQGRTATASSSEGANVGPQYAVDGDAGTRWSSTFADNQTLTIDLGAVANVCRVALNWESAYGKAFQVQVSDSATTGFATIATVTNGIGGNQVLDAVGTGRYLRLNLQTRATGYGFSLWEVKVWTTGGSPTTGPTTPTTTPTTPTTTTTTPTTTTPTTTTTTPTTTTTTTPTTDPTTYPADGKVRIVGSQGNWKLVVNGQPWTVKGMTWGPAVADFPSHVANLKAMGVNTIRTWGTDAGSKPLFDGAAAAGIRVVAGFWLAPGGGPGSGGCPNYVTDATYKANSMNDIVQWVTAYKDNPGVLMWDVGNESLLGLQNCYSGSDLEAERNAYASFVNDAAKKIHSIDPNHPVTSTDAWTGSWVYYKANAPDLDLYGLNSYGAICDAKQTWIAGGYTKPYLITEGGPQGSWEAPGDVNGIPNQGTDQDNADGYTKAWNCIQAHSGVALGATFFHYGLEGDFGGIWFNVLPGGNKRLSYYAIAKAYGGPAGNPGTNTPPTFQNMSINSSTSITAGSTVTMNAAVSDPNGDAITYHVFINSNPIDNAGGLLAVPFTKNGTTYTFTAPQTLGVWKAYIFAEDGHSNVGVQTVSFRVVPPAVGGTNLALGRPATASSFDQYNGNFTAGQATDGNYATRWSSKWTDGEWIQVDLGAKKTFHNVQLAWESAYGKGYTIQQSDDGTTWAPIATVTNGDGNVDTIAVDGNARYVRMQGVTRGTGYGYSLFEFGIYS